MRVSQAKCSTWLTCTYFTVALYLFWIASLEKNLYQVQWYQWLPIILCVVSYAIYKRKTRFLTKLKQSDYGPPRIWRRLLFCKMLLFSNRFRRHLWTDLYKALTHDVYRSAIELYEEILWYWLPKKLGPKNCLFSMTSQLNGNFEGQYLRRETWHRQSGNDG